MDSEFVTFRILDLIEELQRILTDHGNLLILLELDDYQEISTSDFGHPATVSVSDIDWYGYPDKRCVITAALGTRPKLFRTLPSPI